MKTCRNIIVSIDGIMKKNISERTLRNILFFVFIGSLIPLFFIAKYNFPSVDDFGFAARAKTVWENERNIWLVLKNAIQQSYNTYFQWQGCFTASFLLALNPIAFDEKLYCVVPVIIILLLVVSTFFFSKMIFGEIFGVNRNQVICISVIWSFFNIQFLPSAVQGYYWYTGAVAYTVFYSLALILYGIMIFVALEEKNISVLHKWIFVIAICFLAIICGGGNYVTAILSFFVFFLFISIQYVTKRNYRIFMLPYAVFVISFIINMISPGNGVRKNGSSYSMIFSAVYYTIVYAFEKVNEWMNLSTLIMIALIIPILLNIIKSTAYRFVYPMLITVISLGLYSIQFFPHSFALGTAGPDRLLNIIYFSFIFCVIFNTFYWMGWFYQRKISEKIHEKNGKKSHTICSIGIIGVLMLIFCISLKAEFPSTSIAAVYSIVTNESKNYYEENQERILVLKDKSQKNVKLKAYKHKPMVLFWDDGDENPKNWRNEAMAGFYGKESIIVEN